MLYGKKVILRPIDPDRDFGAGYTWINNYEVMGFLGGVCKPVTKQKEKEILQKMADDDESRIHFAVDDRSGRHVGFVGLYCINWEYGTAEAGGMIGDKMYWGIGYGTDALMLLLYYAFCHRNFRRISAGVIAFNKRSLGCARKCGFIVEGVKKKEMFKNGQYHDLIMLAVFRRGWMRLWRNYVKEQRKKS